MRKITNDTTVRYIPKSQQTKEKDSKPKTIKAGSLPRKQNKKPSQNNKKFLKIVVASGFGYLSKQLYCSSYLKWCKYTMLIL